ncbi:SIR2 family NAD-dependent protein deacylase [Methylobacterium sp. R2-1]|uniref:SIR2 family NAD-dependent protein deacylase n=1 Tax=Methylobacterium sp. R2-1 TaxID=2587064 RepID=UPI001619D439|nr:NAD-dependent deacylase [Methylobacterium sp. R2-1]MBB2963699.1 NAD-dependent deacetylase [Methylobacterium sp. R2-1]
MTRNVFALTGAGISAESGLGTFRDTDGAWARFDPMRLATPEGFAADPVLVHEFYNHRRRDALAAAPNPAHAALARLETELAERGGRLFLCTQNIDDLHEREGSRHVVHMHGELLRARCTACGTEAVWHDDLTVETPCPHCGRSGGMRPDVVWFGEMPKHLDTIDEALAEADLFVAVGTSGAVYPAAGYVAQARAFGIPTLALNLEAADNAGMFEATRLGRASETVPAFVEEVLGERR